MSVTDLTDPQTPARVRKPRHRDIQAARALTSTLLPEVRHFAAHGLEIRSASDAGDAITIAGTPIVYNAPYEVRDQFGLFQETMLPGVVNGLVSTADVRFLFNHDGYPFARTTTGTLVLEDRADGLHFTAQLDARSHAHNDLAIAIERGDISQMSVGFSVAPEGDEWNDAMDERSISQFRDLLDVSAVTYPASPTTSIEIAKRMALAAPVESSARIFHLATEIRAGKVLSTSNQQLLVDAVAAMHQVLDGAGFDPGDLIDKADDDIPGHEPEDRTEDPIAEAVAEQLSVEDDGAAQRALSLHAEYLALRRRR